MQTFVILLCITVTWARPNLNLQPDGVHEGNTTEKITYESRNCDCGRKPTVSKIVNGVKAGPGEFPWLLATLKLEQKKWYIYCGSSLISPRFVLTAAHCNYGLEPKQLKLYAKSNKLFTTGEDIQIQSIVRHAQYNTVTQENDIAIYTLVKDVVYTELLRPICLPFSMTSDTFDKKTITVSGWGYLTEDGPASDDLMKVDLKIKSNTECQTAMGSNLVFPTSICTYGGDKDSCRGDSGGPLMYLVKGVFYQIGIVSWGEGCARPNKFGINTRVTSYLTWISKNTNGICKRA